jgi:tRNA(His) guanylyltransferase
MDKTTIGDRMKRYEVVTKSLVTPRTPLIIRVDGKAFHTFTKRLNEKVDPTCSYGPSQKMHNVMMNTTQAMCQQMQNVVLAYTQSDEISFVLRDWDTIQTQQWFGGNVQKMASVSASMAAVYFNFFWAQEFGENPDYVGDLALFDSRVFTLPKEEVTNYLLWRQQDATRNSINFIARLHFSHKELHGKNVSQVQEMLWSEHDCNWNDYATWKKRGSCVVKNPNPFDSSSAWVWDDEIPIFSKERDYVETRLDPVKEEAYGEINDA